MGKDDVFQVRLSEEHWNKLWQVMDALGLPKVKSSENYRKFIDALPIQVQSQPETVKKELPKEVNLQECEYFSEYPQKPDYIKCNKTGKWKILKREQCEACNFYKTYTIEYDKLDKTLLSMDKEQENLEAMIERHNQTLANLTSQRTRLTEEVRKLKDKIPTPTPPPPSPNPKLRAKIKELETELEEAKKKKPKKSYLIMDDWISAERNRINKALVKEGLLDERDI